MANLLSTIFRINYYFKKEEVPHVILAIKKYRGD
jgi:hypothetical protein